tara:strand:- start:105464 stop:106411 length:948 start_codon:yes stop_codon:yes gene_type:complete
VNTAENLALDFAVVASQPNDTKDESATSQVDIWREELKTELAAFSEAFDRFKKAESTLYNYINKSAAHLNEMSCTEEVINKWIENKCSEASTIASNTGHLSITPERLPSEISSFSFPRRYSFYEDDPELENGKSIFDASTNELARYALTHYDFSALETELKKVSVSIESEGFKDAANSLGSTFGITYRHHQKQCVLPVKKQKGRYILEASYYGSWVHDRVRSLHSIKEVAQTFEAETGANGLVTCLYAAIRAEEAVQDRINGFVESRTKVYEGGGVEAVFFRDKIKFHFKPDVFEALVGFVQSYADTNLKTIEVK